jgi:hypothetical protein
MMHITSTTTTNTTTNNNNNNSIVLFMWRVESYKTNYKNSTV